MRLGAPWACARCIARIPRLHPPCCRHCSRPLRGSSIARPPDATDTDTPELNCRFCRIRPPFQWATHVGTYEGTLRTHIQRLKFENYRVVAQTLGHLLAVQVMSRLDRNAPSAIVPVPLHANRLASRGFNQAALLAQAVTDHCGVPQVHALRRQLDTPSQARLSLRERQNNLRGAFLVAEPAAVRGRHVVLVDDVYTTGVTSREAAFTLLRAGAAAVGIACVAITVADADMLV